MSLCLTPKLAYGMAFTELRVHYGEKAPRLSKFMALANGADFHLHVIILNIYRIST